ncbi:MAG: chloride channel protein, partial [Pseudomonadota bacterium]
QWTKRLGSTVGLSALFGGVSGLAGALISASALRLPTGPVVVLVATAIFPEVSGSVGLYALAGMGGVAASILGAPISTTLIVFELTGDWQTGLAVMVCVSLSIAVSTRLMDRSFFLTQLERRGVHLAAGPQAYLQATLSVGDLMHPQGGDRSVSETTAFELMEQGAVLTRADTLEQALPLFEQLGSAFLPVIAREDDGSETLLGALYHIDALKAYNRALAALAKEEHS